MRFLFDVIRWIKYNIILFNVWLWRIRQEIEIGGVAKKKVKIHFSVWFVISDVRFIIDVLFEIWILHVRFTAMNIQMGLIL